MSGANRDKFFAAAHVLATTDYSVGLALYGDDFNTITNFTKIHLNNAGTRNTDHLHDGLGFLTQHAAMTMAFERSLRSVDAAISVPYWDFTYGGDWFGNASGSKYHTIETGRWAWQKVAVVDHEDPAIHNAYGLLRAPWNTNKSPFLTRAHSMCAHETFSLTDWPSCEEHYAGLRVASWYEWGWAVQYSPTAPSTRWSAAT
ncbi:phosphatase [Aureococcus anophagefferens]|nr:phosphatase [Aureococcus anophagefferens]